MDLDHLYAPDQSGQQQDIANLKQKVTNLGNIVVKNNIADQVLLQQKINQAPTQNEHIVRWWDLKFQRVVETSTNIAANTPTAFTPQGLGITSGTLHEFIIKMRNDGVDYTAGLQMFINNNNYRNMGPVLNFSNSELTVDFTCKVWTENQKIYIRANKAIPQIEIYMRHIPKA